MFSCFVYRLELIRHSGLGDCITVYLLLQCIYCFVCFSTKREWDLVGVGIGTDVIIKQVSPLFDSEVVARQFVIFNVFWVSRLCALFCRSLSSTS